ncbi:hypothetical protein FHX81_2046 [Saccharothrix saharensis]|uniref:Methyltransferase family protein n=1 Tax=Saccharothrix saharensis TaxID=571190 RepID=A0A543JA94_9PSEU|nr:hypothetical protein FHX81_2046 [Saccharothrix saharensis]
MEVVRARPWRSPAARWVTDLGAQSFDRVAADDDRAVPFFATFGARLVGWAAPEAGARVLDLGAGRAR